MSYARQQDRVSRRICLKACGLARKLGLVLALILALISSLAPKPAVARPAITEDLVGIVIGGREVGTLLIVRRGGRAWLPLTEFASFTKIVVKRGSGGQLRKIRTPLGETNLPSAALLTFRNVDYIDSRYLIDELNFAIKSNVEEFTLNVAAPWSGRRRGDPPPFDGSKLEPEVLPPSHGIATLHGTMNYQKSNSSDSVFDNTFKMTGFSAGGVWQLSYEDDLVADRRIRDAIWMKQLTPQRLIQIGHQSVALHPLLNSQEMTGVQYAWSSRPVVMSGTSFYPGALLTRRAKRQRSFSGRGPIGGWVELWVDGLLISRRDIKLDGTFEFDDIPLASRQARVEIRIYDHHQPDTPSEIINETIELSDLLLDSGQATALASGGLRGNAFDVLGQETDYGGGVAGVAFGRWGLNDSVTLEGAVDVTEDGQRVMGGVVAQLYHGVFATLSTATDQSGQFGYDAELSIKKKRWKMMLSSFQALSIAQDGSSAEQKQPTHIAHLGLLFSRALEAGVIGRNDEDANFMLPYAYWSPNRFLTMRIQPDRVGDYEFDASYRWTPMDTFTLSVDYEYTALTYTHLFSTGMVLSVRTGVDYDEKSPDLKFSLAHDQFFGFDTSWRAALLTSHELNFGFEVSLRKRLREGVFVYVDAASHHKKRERTGSVFGDRNDLRLRLGLSFDLAFSQSGLAKAAYGGVRPDSGNLAGVVAPTAKGADLSGIPILVDGKYRGRTSSDGSFFVSGVRKGNHIVEFEEDSLPLEHVATKRSIVARVAPGAVTSLTFNTSVYYGAAGRVVADSGEGVSDAALVVLNRDGQQISASTTNRFGYYRVDNLASGRYRAEVRDAKGKVVASRNFAISNDYVFDIILKVPPPSQWQ